MRLRQMVYLWSALLVSTIACRSAMQSGEARPPEAPLPAAWAEAESWDVSLDLAALDELPYSCFHPDELVVRPHREPTEQVRWALLPGAPDELHLGRIQLALGDVGPIELPHRLRGGDGVFRTTQVRVQLEADSAEATRTETTLVMRTEGDRLRGTLHVEALQGCGDGECADARLQCAVSIGVLGRRVGGQLLAAAY